MCCPKEYGARPEESITHAGHNHRDKYVWAICLPEASSQGIGSLPCSPHPNDHNLISH